MKKLIFGVVLLTALSACKKESTVIENDEDTMEEVIIADGADKPMTDVIPFKRINLFCKCFHAHHSNGFVGFVAFSHKRERN